MAPADNAPLPDYEPLMAAYHGAFAGTLRRMLEALPICAGDRVLDVGCGDGFYTRELGALVAPSGEVIGVDRLPAYLRVAERRSCSSPYAACLRFQRGDVRRLPFRSETFDAIWCAQSLYSFPHPQRALREMARVTRRGGVVAILEDDTLHQILLPWPIDMELSIREAEWRALRRQRKDAQRFYIARQLRELFAGAGLRPQRRRTYASNCETPLNDEERRFFDAYLADLWSRTKPYLPPSKREALRLLLMPGSKTYLAGRSDFDATVLDHVMWGKKP